MKSDSIVTSKVTNHPGLPGTFPDLALKVLSPERPFGPRQPWEIIESVVLDYLYVQPTSCSQGTYGFQRHEKAIYVLNQFK